jgi:hypothetical protein
VGSAGKCKEAIECIIGLKLCMPLLLQLSQVNPSDLQGFSLISEYRYLLITGHIHGSVYGRS